MEIVSQYLANKQANIQSEAQVSLQKKAENQAATVVSTLIEGATSTERPKEPGKGALVDKVA